MSAPGFFRDTVGAKPDNFRGLMDIPRLLGGTGIEVCMKVAIDLCWLTGLQVRFVHNDVTVTVDNDWTLERLMHDWLMVTTRGAGRMMDYRELGLTWEQAQHLWLAA